MRPYPPNSPRAAARIVALTLLADGQLQRSELSSLEALHGHERLGLRRFELHAVLHDFCTDLIEDAKASRDDDCRITPALIDLLLSDIDEPRLQRQVLALCAGVARADGRLDDGESVVLSAAIEQWGMAPPGFELPPPRLLPDRPRATAGPSRSAAPRKACPPVRQSAREARAARALCESILGPRSG